MLNECITGNMSARRPALHLYVEQQQQQRRSIRAVHWAFRWLQSWNSLVNRVEATNSPLQPSRFHHQKHMDSALCLSLDLWISLGFPTNSNVLFARSGYSISVSLRQIQAKKYQCGNLKFVESCKFQPNYSLWWEIVPVQCYDRPTMYEQDFDISSEGDTWIQDQLIDSRKEWHRCDLLQRQSLYASQNL
jgi:hypothetical protein